MHGCPSPRLLHGDPGNFALDAGKEPLNGYDAPLTMELLARHVAFEMLECYEEALFPPAFSQRIKVDMVECTGGNMLRKPF